MEHEWCWRGENVTMQSLFMALFSQQLHSLRFVCGSPCMSRMSDLVSEHTHLYVQS